MASGFRSAKRDVARCDFAVCSVGGALELLENVLAGVSRSRTCCSCERQRPPRTQASSAAFKYPSRPSSTLVSPKGYGHTRSTPGRDKGSGSITKVGFGSQADIGGGVRMSALGQKQTSEARRAMSAFDLKQTSRRAGLDGQRTGGREHRPRSVTQPRDHRGLTCECACADAVEPRFPHPGGAIGAGEIETSG